MRIEPRQYDVATRCGEPREQNSCPGPWTRISFLSIVMRSLTEPGYPRADNENIASAI